MISTKYSRKLKQTNDKIVSAAIQHEKDVGIYDVPNPIKHKMTLSEAILSHPHSGIYHKEASISGTKTGSGKSAVAYKRQVPVIGGGNVDF